MVTFTMIDIIDASVLEILHGWRIDGVASIFLFLNTIGDTAVMLAVTLIVAAILYWWYRQRSVALGLLATMATSTTITYLLKHLVVRTRPDALYQAYLETGFSFPSGHSSAAAAFCGFFAYVAWTRMPAGTRRTLLVAVLVGYALLMAFGRLYLGVHYFSDVMVGLAVGALSAWVGTLVVMWLKKREALKGAPFAQ